MDNLTKIRCRYVEDRFHNNDNGFRISVFKADLSEIPMEYHRDTDRSKLFFNAKGVFEANKSFDVLLSGNLSISKKYGLTMNVKYSEIVMPTSEEGIIKYLSEFVNGCGKGTAKKIVNKYGANTLDILNENPDVIREIKGIGKKSADKIIDSLLEILKLQGLIKLFLPYNNITRNSIIKVSRELEVPKGRKVEDVIKENPFVLRKIEGFSYDTLNTMSINYNCSPNNPDRIACAISSVLKEMQLRGNLCIPQQQLLYRANSKLCETSANLVSQKEIVDTICQMAKSNELLGDNGFAYLSYNYSYEQRSAIEIDRKTYKKTNIKVDFESLEQQLNISLGKNQKEAVEMVCNNNLSIITGGAGTGKTTVLKSILYTLYNNDIKKSDVLLLSPTGKAAQRMSETTGHSAYTVHKALNLRAEYDPNKEEEIETLSYKYIFIDEVSMMDQYLLYRFLIAVDNSSSICFIGDSAQLPSVGAGSILSEMLKSNIVPHTELNVIFRQAQENPIVKNASNIRNGKQSMLFNDDFKFVQANEDNIENVITQIYLSEALTLGVDNVQVLSPLKNKGVGCTNNLNVLLQSIINGTPLKEKSIKGTSFRVGDKVINTKNQDYEDNFLSNGDVGRIKDITFEGKRATFHIDFTQISVDFTEEQMQSVELAYAMTVHKSQGSEYNTIILPLLDYFPKNMLYRNLLYTAVTRAKKKVIIVGNENNIYYAIGNNKIASRNSQLASKIQKYFANNKDK